VVEQTTIIHLRRSLHERTRTSDRIAKNAETQQTGSGTARGGTTSKTVLRDAVLLELKGINRTAAAIAVSQDKPEIMDKFRIPHGDSDAVLVAKAIAEAANGMTADFDIYGHEATFVADFLAQIEAFNKAEGTRTPVSKPGPARPMGFAPLLQEAMTKVRQLDAFMHNLYRTNAPKLGEWHVASHIERQAQKKETPAKPSPTP
jgi:hypothetical protein